MTTLSAPSAATRRSQQTVVIEPRRGWVGLDLRELWAHRELVVFLAMRDIRLRYKQSLLGVAWAVLQPLLTMVVFTLLFGVLLHGRGMPTVAGVPYAVSTYCALVPWQLFSRSLGASGDSLVANRALITKVYFPRLVMPVAPTLAALVDFGMAFVILVAMMLAYGIVPSVRVVALLPLVLLAVVTALSVSLWLSAVNAIYRDVRYGISFLLQLWMYASPVVYTTRSIFGGHAHHLGWLRFVYECNPIAVVVEGFRWALLGGHPEPWGPTVVALLAVLVLLASGAFFFRRMERLIVDLV